MRLGIWLYSHICLRSLTFDLMKHVNERWWRPSWSVHARLQNTNYPGHNLMTNHCGMIAPILDICPEVLMQYDWARSRNRTCSDVELSACRQVMHLTMSAWVLSILQASTKLQHFSCKIDMIRSSHAPIQSKAMHVVPVHNCTWLTQSTIGKGQNEPHDIWQELCEYPSRDGMQ